jgi:CheY-like chemotaxis protein/HPt (histidine-containing phosphotransfer) domain-containing protein
MTQASYTMKHYCLLNICFLVISTIASLFIYDAAADFTSVPNSRINDVELFTYQLIIIVLGSGIAFSILSWICLFGAGSPRKALPEWASYARQKNTQEEIALSINIDSPDTMKGTSHSALNATFNTTKEPASPVIKTKRSNHPIDNSISNDAPIRLLIVDDNPANIMVIENYLLADNRTIITATNGLDAIQSFEKTPADIIFMDIEMEGMDGPQTLQHIRALEKLNSITRVTRTPIIAVSAHKEIEKKIDMLQQGFDDYLAKPVGPEKLKSTLQRWQTAHERNKNHALSLPTPQYKKTGIKEIKTEESTHFPTHPFPQKPHNITRKNTHQKDLEHLQKSVSIASSLVHSNHNSLLAKDMLELLIKMIKQEKKNITDLCREQNWEKLYQLNHKIYGGSSYCGVPQLQSANKKLERLLQCKLTLAQPDTINAIAEQPNTNSENDIEQAVEDLKEAIDDIILWDDQHDIDVIFNIN